MPRKKMNTSNKRYIKPLVGILGTGTAFVIATCNDSGTVVPGILPYIESKDDLYSVNKKVDQRETVEMASQAESSQESPTEPGTPEPVNKVPLYAVTPFFLLAAPDSTEDVSSENAHYNEISQESTEYDASTKELLSRIQIGADYTYVNLKPRGHHSFTGNLGGLQGSYEYKPRNSIYAGATFSWKEGDTRGSGDKRSLLYIDTQERLGYTVSFQKVDLQLTLFTGLGYRHIGQKLETSDDVQLKFRYNEFYIPVGFLTDYAVSSWFNCGLGITWMPQVYPTVAITPLKGARWSLTDTMPNFFAELPLDFSLTKNKKFHLVLDPFYERWNDGHSTAVTSTGVPLGLPGNMYNFWGVNLNFLYCF